MKRRTKKHKKTKRQKSQSVKTNKKLIRILTFFIKLNIFSIPLIFIISTNYQFAEFIELTTFLSFQLVSPMGAELSNNIIKIPVENGFWGAKISWDSTGWKSILTLFALIFATDFSLRKKLFGLILIPLIYCINLIRIWFMFFAVSLWGPEIFDLIHTIIWSWGLILTMLIFWFAWMKYAPE